jgi:hypothetical protein
LSGAQTGFDTFAAGIGGSNTTYYAIFNQGTPEYEVGLATLDAGGTILTRTTVFTSSNSDTVVNFSSGIKDVFCTLPASKAILVDPSSNIDVTGDTFITTSDGNINLTPNGTGDVVISKVDINAGSIDGTIIGANSAAAITATSLDVDNININGNTVSSTNTDGNITLTPNGTGKVSISSILYPNADGTADQVLTTDGSGTLSFADVAGGAAWQAIQTGNFNANVGEGYFVNTSGGAITATLPASPVLGEFIAFVDYAGTFDTNSLTVARNGKPIQGVAEDLTVSVERAGFTLIFVDDTQGWLLQNK